MDADGGNVGQLTHDAQVGPLDPSWSPDGSWIAYTGPVEGSKQLAIYLVSPETGAISELGPHGDVCCPAWQPIAAGSPSPSSTPIPTPSQVGMIDVGERVNLGAEASALLYADGSLWVASLNDPRTVTGTVLRIDPDSGEILARISVDAYPGSESGGGGMLFDGRFVWIVGTRYSEGGPEQGILVRIDPETNAAEAVDLPVGAADTDLVFDGGYLWTTGVFSPGKDPRVLQVDPASGDVFSQTPIHAEWWGNLVVKDGAIWIMEMSVRNSTVLGDARLVRLEPGTGAQLASVQVVDEYGVMGSAAPLSAGGAIWAPTGSELLQIDPQSGAVLSSSTLDVGGDLQPAADGSLWCLCGRRWDSLQRLNPVTHEVDVTASLDPTPIPVAIAVSPNAIWVLDYQGGLTRLGLT